MTDTAKPTPPQWIESHMPHRNGDGYGYGGEPTVCIPNAEVLIIKSDLHRKIILEAGNVHSETNLTPRQLVERVRELEAVRDNLNAGIYQLYDYAVNRGDDNDFSLQISILIRQLTEFSFAKHGEGV